MIGALRHLLLVTPEPKRVAVKSWREHAKDGRVRLGAHERITVAHPKARFATLDPSTAYTGWVNPGRFGAGLIWMATVAGFAVYGRKTGRGPLKDLHGYAPFSTVDEER